MSDRAGRRFFGGLLIAVGVLIATLSGLCSFGFVAAAIGGLLKGQAGLTNLVFSLMLVAVFGGVPFTVGAALIIAGRAALRAAS